MRIKFFTFSFLIILLLSAALTAQSRSSSRIEDSAKNKFLIDKSLEEFRYDGDTRITEPVIGNVIVRDGNLTVNANIEGDVIVLFGDVRVKNGATVTGDIVSIDGRISQDDDAHVKGNQIETPSKNLMGGRDWTSNRNYSRSSARSVSSSKSYRYYAEVDEDEYAYEYYEDDDYYPHRSNARYYSKYSTLPIGNERDDFVVAKYNRVQGLFLGLGIPKQLGSRYEHFTAYGFAGYGFKDEQWRYQLGVDRWLFNRDNFRFEIGAQIYDLTDTKDAWLVDDVENSLSAALLKKDYYDFYRRTGYEFHASQNLTIFMKGTIGYRNDEYESLTNRARWSLFNDDDKFRKNPAINEGNMRSIFAEFLLDTRDNIENPRRGWYTRAYVETSNKNNLKSDFSFNQYILEVRRYQPVGWRERLDIRFKLGSVEGNNAPIQKLFAMGGLSTLRGYYNKSLNGNRMVLLNLEYNLNPRVFSTDFLLFDNLKYVLFYDIGDAWNANPNSETKWTDGFSKLRLTEMKSDIGLAITFDSGKYRFSMAKRLDNGTKPLTFSFRMVKPF